MRQLDALVDTLVDDASAGQYTDALPILQRLGMPATLLCHDRRPRPAKLAFPRRDPGAGRRRDEDRRRPYLDHHAVTRYRDKASGAAHLASEAVLGSRVGGLVLTAAALAAAAVAFVAVYVLAIRGLGRAVTA